MNKRWAILLLLCSGAAPSAIAESSCRILIGDEWIAMGVNALNSCLKYAEAAASPGERQVAEFDAQRFSYLDGRYFTSNDGGSSWQDFEPFDSVGQISALNTLQGADGVTGKETPGSKADETPGASAAGGESPVPVAAVEGSASVDGAAAPSPLDGDASVPASAGAERTPDPATHPAPREDAHAIGCQIRTGEAWFVVPAASLQACADMLVRKIGDGVASGQAYWGGNYLFYSEERLYESPDGRSWQELTGR